MSSAWTEISEPPARSVEPTIVSTLYSLERAQAVVETHHDHAGTGQGGAVEEGIAGLAVCVPRGTIRAE